MAPQRLIWLWIYQIYHCPDCVTLSMTLIHQGSAKKKATRIHVQLHSKFLKIQSTLSLTLVYSNIKNNSLGQVNDDK